MKGRNSFYTSISVYVLLAFLKLVFTWNIQNKWQLRPKQLLRTRCGCPWAIPRWCPERLRRGTGKRMWPWTGGWRRMGTLSPARRPGTRRPRSSSCSLYLSATALRMASASTRKSCPQLKQVSNHRSTLGNAEEETTGASRRIAYVSDHKAFLQPNIGLGPQELPSG